MNKRQILQFSIGPIGSAFLSFISVPIVAWLFAVEDVGRIAMLHVTISFCILICCLGLDQAYVREYHECEDKPALLKNAVTPGLLILGAVVGVTLLVDASLLSRLLFGLDSVIINAAVVLCVVAAFVSRFLSLILRMEERGMAYSMSQLLPKLSFLVVVFVFVFFNLENSFGNLLFAHLVSLLCVLVVFGKNTAATWLSSFARSIDKKLLSKMLRFGAPLVIASMASWGLNVMDRIFLRGMSTYEQLGIYSVATSIAGVAFVFTSIFNTVWMPSVYKWVSENRNLEIVEKVSNHVLAATYFAFVFFGLFSWVFPLLFPTSYSSVQYIVMACAAGPLLYMLSETTAVGIGVTRRTKYAMLASGGAVILNGIGNYILVPMYGAAGAASATAIAFLFFLILRTEISIWLWRRRKRCRVYSTTVSCVTLAVYSALLSEAYPYSEIILSFVFLGVGLVLFSSSLHALYEEGATIFKKLMPFR